MGRFTMALLILVLFLGDFIFDLFYVWKDNKKRRYITKSLLMPLLLIFYLTADKNPNVLVAIALIFGFLGDVFLLPEDKNWCFIAGILSFMLGHIFYIASYIKILSATNHISPWYYALILPYVIYGILVFKFVGNKMGELKVAAGVYISVILFSSLTCLLVILSCKSSMLLTYIGTLLFVASDSILGYCMFISKKKLLDILVMVTYVMAQAFIVLGFLR